MGSIGAHFLYLYFLFLSNFEFLIKRLARFTLSIQFVYFPNSYCIAAPVKSVAAFVYSTLPEKPFALAKFNSLFAFFRPCWHWRALALAGLVSHPDIRKIAASKNTGNIFIVI